MDSPENTVQDKLLTFQQDEIDSHHIYSRLAPYQKNEDNRKILEHIAADENQHAVTLQSITHKDVRPNKRKINFYVLVSRLFGITFGLKLLEREEKSAQEGYASVENEAPQVGEMIKDEETHEQKLINMINEEKLDYMGSVVLGLNDALVELTGTLAGLTFAFQNTALIALSGFITGIAASLSMAVSEYLSNRAEGNNHKALKSSIYTGGAYVITVLLLILPYVLFDNFYLCLAVTLVIALMIILAFNYYISVAKGFNFRRRFTEMAVLSLGVAAISFGIGFLLRTFLGVDI